MVTRKSKRQLYAFEFADEAKHCLLLHAATHCHADVMISTYENKLYDSFLLPRQLEGNREWHKHKFPAMTHAGIATECIYMNYPPPTVLHDFRYIGKNYRERERIKKKVNRHRARLDRLPASERTAILSALVQQFNETVNTIIQL